VVRHFAIDVRLVELVTAQRLQMRETLLTIGFQALAGWVVLRYDLELGCDDDCAICASLTPSADTPATGSKRRPAAARTMAETFMSTTPSFDAIRRSSSSGQQLDRRATDAPSGTRFVESLELMLWKDLRPPMANDVRAAVGLDFHNES
jgi:hypothetical protein